MHADISLVFRAPPAEGPVDTAAPSLAGYVAELVRVPGVRAARAFAVNVVLGERTPAFYPELVMYELDGAGHDSEAAMTALGVGGSGGLTRADGLRFAAWDGTSVGARSDFELPDHLYLQFSAQPASLSFDAYSDWYPGSPRREHRPVGRAAARLALPARAGRSRRRARPDTPRSVSARGHARNPDIRSRTGDGGRRDQPSGLVYAIREPRSDRRRRSGDAMT